MAGISAIPPMMPPSLGPVGAASSSAAAPKVGEQFGQALRNALDKVDSQQQTAQSAIQDVVAGGAEDVIPAVSAMARADLSFKLLIGVRNKMIDAYKQTLNMQI
jgi:flagellar hook-basal body complex protein FliE